MQEPGGGGREGGPSQNQCYLPQKGERDRERRKGERGERERQGQGGSFPSASSLFLLSLSLSSAAFWLPKWQGGMRERERHDEVELLSLLLHPPMSLLIMRETGGILIAAREIRSAMEEEDDQEEEEEGEEGEETSDLC